MVQNIGCVHHASLSTSTGRFDFKSDMLIIKPDIYIVNDDGSGMETRVEICKELGIEMIVPKRKPKAGLEERSSTSMKARLTEHVHQELTLQGNTPFSTRHIEQTPNPQTEGF